MVIDGLLLKLYVKVLTTEFVALLLKEATGNILLNNLRTVLTKDVL